MAIAIDGLSRRDRKVLLAVLGYKVLRGGQVPTLRELVILTDINSTSVIASSLRDLQDAGYVVLGDHAQTRSIAVVGERYLPPELIDEGTQEEEEVEDGI